MNKRKKLFLLYGKKMKLSTLLLILGLILFLFCIFSKGVIDYFVPGNYVISWQAPMDNGGDTTCCGYDWQVCALEDTECKTPVDSGSVAPGATKVAYTTKVTWGDTYNVMIRAKNIYGPGPWTTAQLVAGGGTIDAITFGEIVDANGNVVKPLNPSSTNIMVFASINEKESLPTNTLNAVITAYIKRGNSQIPLLTKLQMKPGMSGGKNTFLANGLLNSHYFKNGDVIKADIYITTSKNAPFTESQASYTLTGTVPGAVSGIIWTYIPFGSPSPFNKPLGCQDAIDHINTILTAGGTPTSTLSLASASAKELIASSDYQMCSDYQKGYALVVSTASPPATCVDILIATNPLLSSNAQKCGAYDGYYKMRPLLTGTCFNDPINPTITSWQQGCSQ